MENYRSDMFRLQNFMDQHSVFGSFGDPNYVHHSQTRNYKMQYVKTAKFNSKTNQFEPYDKRTNTFYNEKDANKFIVDNVKKNRKTFFLEKANTATPKADLEYLQAYNKLQILKSDKEHSPVWAIRNSFSTKIEGTDSTVYEQEWLQKIKNEEARVLKLKSGTKYEREELKNLRNRFKEPETKQP